MGLVCGVGINDADYVVQKKESIGPLGFGRRKQKLVWHTVLLNGVMVLEMISETPNLRT